MKIEKNNFENSMTFSAENRGDHQILLGLADILGLKVFTISDGKTHFPSATIKRESQYYQEIKKGFNRTVEHAKEHEKKYTKLRKQLRANKIKPEF